jgi:hypothetical protein
MHLAASGAPATVKRRAVDRVHTPKILPVCVSYLFIKKTDMAVPYLERLVAGFQPRRPGFNPVLDDVGFVVDRTVLEQVFLEYSGSP